MNFDWYSWLGWSGEDGLSKESSDEEFSSEIFSSELKSFRFYDTRHFSRIKLTLMSPPLIDYLGNVSMPSSIQQTFRLFLKCLCLLVLLLLGELEESWGIRGRFTNQVLVGLK